MITVPPVQSLTLDELMSEDREISIALEYCTPPHPDCTSWCAACASTRRLYRDRAAIRSELARRSAASEAAISAILESRSTIEEPKTYE